MLTEVLGQPRAVAALSFGAGIGGQGFNLFTLGQPGSGRTTLIRNYLEQHSGTRPVPCCVYNFANAGCPLPLHLPAGRAAQVKKDIDALVEELETEIPKAFETEEYTSQRDQVLEELEEKRREKLAQIDQRAVETVFRLRKEPGGLLLACRGRQIARPPGPRTAQARRPRQRHPRASASSTKSKSAPHHRRAGKGRARRAPLPRYQTAAWASRHVIEDLCTRYKGQPAVLDYLAALETDIAAHADDRKGKESENPPQLAPWVPPTDRPSARRYQVNVLVDNTALQGAPVIVETDPTYHNLTGRIEQQATWNGVITNHTMIKPGALHRANGGYLIIPARECLMNPFAWEGLKRTLN